MAYSKSSGRTPSENTLYLRNREHSTTWSTLIGENHFPVPPVAIRLSIDRKDGTKTVFVRFPSSDDTMKVRSSLEASGDIVVEEAYDDLRLSSMPKAPASMKQYSHLLKLHPPDPWTISDFQDLFERYYDPGVTIQQCRGGTMLAIFRRFHTAYTCYQWISRTNLIPEFISNEDKDYFALNPWSKEIPLNPVTHTIRIHGGAHFWDAARYFMRYQKGVKEYQIDGNDVVASFVTGHHAMMATEEIRLYCGWFYGYIEDADVLAPQQSHVTNRSTSNGGHTSEEVYV